MIQLYETPFRAHKENNALQSRWVSANLPVLFKFRRYDWYAGAVSSSGSLLKVTLSITLGETMPEAGDNIVLSSTSGTYSGTFVLSSVTVYGGGLFADLVINTPYAGPSDLYASTYRPEFRLFLDIYLFNSKTLASKKIETSWTPDPSGFIRVNVTDFITEYLSTDDDLGYPVTPGPDKSNCGRFYFKGREVYTGSPETEINMQAGTLTYFNNSVKQLGEPYGQNLCDYVPFPDSSLVTKARFLSDFERPSFWPGYPFDLAYIHDISLKFTAFSYMEKRDDVNGTELGDEIKVIPPTGLNYEGRVTPVFPTDVPGYSDTVKALRVWLFMSGTLGELYVDGGFVDDDYVEGEDDVIAAAERITEIKTIDVEKCTANPYYLRWKGSRGGWNYWLFTDNQELETGTKEGPAVSVEPDDLEFATRRNKITKRAFGDVVRLGAYLDTGKIKGLKTILGSPEVQLYRGASDPRWLTVEVNRGSFKMETRNNRADVSLEISLPEFYTIEQ